MRSDGGQRPIFLLVVSVVTGRLPGPRTTWGRAGLSVQGLTTTACRLADSEPDQVARVQGEVSAIPEGMTELVNDERGIPSYDFWCNRHARMSCVTPADLIQAVPVA